jgi:hypothetical protein
MGFYVRIEESTFNIPNFNLDKAYKAMCDLNKDNSKKRGGYGNIIELQKSTEYSDSFWFAFMLPDYPNHYADAAAIFIALGFEITLDESGLHIIGFDSKSGQEDLFLEAVAPYANGLIVWRSEDGEVWRNVFSDNKLLTQPSELTFVVDKEMVNNHWAYDSVTVTLVADYFTLTTTVNIDTHSNVDEEHSVEDYIFEEVCRQLKSEYGFEVTYSMINDIEYSFE